MYIHVNTTWADLAIFFGRWVEGNNIIFAIVVRGGGQDLFFNKLILKFYKFNFSKGTRTPPLTRIGNYTGIYTYQYILVVHVQVHMQRSRGSHIDYVTSFLKLEVVSEALGKQRQLRHQRLYIHTKYNGRSIKWSQWVYQRTQV